MTVLKYYSFNWLLGKRPLFVKVVVQMLSYDHKLFIMVYLKFLFVILNWELCTSLEVYVCAM